MQGKSLELFFVNGKPDGMLTAQIPFQWTGHILVIHRSQLKEALIRKECDRTGVYILLGEKDNEPEVYIGETEEIRSRIKQHAQKKDWWTSAVIITDSDDQLNKAYVKYLESRLIEIATKLNKVKLDNSSAPPIPSLTEAGICNMEGFLQNILTVLPAIKVNYFSSDARPDNSAVTSPEKSDTVYFELVNKKIGVRAKAQLADGEFIVLKGSNARASWEGADCSYTALYHELVKQGVLEINGKVRVFTENYAFKSTSAAGAVVNGRSTAGPRDWKVEGTTIQYKDWEAEQLNKD